MFDRTLVVDSGKEYVPYEKSVVVKKAPTDDSLRLLDEFKKTAFDSILDNVVIKNNILSGTAIVYSVPEQFGAKCIAYKFLLNEKEFKGVFETDLRDFRADNKRGVRETLQKMVKQIASEMVMLMMPDIIKSLNNYPLNDVIYM